MKVQKTLQDLLSKFESIGENCEFGLLQRKHKFEYSNLFRWAFSNNISDTIRLIQGRFEGIYQFRNILPRPGGDMVDDVPNGIAFHSLLRSELVDEEWRYIAKGDDLQKSYISDVQKFSHIRNSTIKSFSTAKRIFVYKRSKGTTQRQICMLLEALQAYNTSNKLLWVALPEVGTKPGDVVKVQPNLYKGYVDRFASFDNAGDFSEEAWLQVLAKVAKLTSKEASPSTDLQEKPQRLWQALQSTSIWVGTTLGDGRKLDVEAGAMLEAQWVAVYMPFFEFKNVSLNRNDLPPNRYFIKFAEWRAD